MLTLSYPPERLRSTDIEYQEQSEKTQLISEKQVLEIIDACGKQGISLAYNLESGFVANGRRFYSKTRVIQRIETANRIAVEIVGKDFVDANLSQREEYGFRLGRCRIGGS